MYRVLTQYSDFSNGIVAGGSRTQERAEATMLRVNESYGFEAAVINDQGDYVAATIGYDMTLGHNDAYRMVEI